MSRLIRFKLVLDACYQTQFYNLCATGTARGGGWRNYGWKGNNCQTWRIINQSS